MKNKKPLKNIINHGTKRVLIVFSFLMFFILTTTSLFILKPFIDVTAKTISSLMINNIISGKYLPNVEKTSALIEIDNLSEKSNYALNNNKGITQNLYLPFLYIVQSNLQEHFSSNVSVVKIAQEPNYYWFYIEQKQLSVGFKKQLIGTRPELTMLILFSCLLLAAWYSSSSLSKKLNAPLLLLKNVTKKLSQGDFTATLPSHELTEINQAFGQVNLLAFHFKHLLEQRTVFLSGISHDIRTPITRLKLLLAINENELSQVFLKKANKALNEVEALTNIYLNSSELLLKNESEKIIINEFLTSVLNEKNDDENKVIQFNNDTQYSTWVNTTALKRVINNLLNNSLKYSNPANKGDISIKIENYEQQVIIEISDCGKGIKNAHLEEVFKPFFRSDEHIQQEGNGLGLSITRQICLSQGWEIQLLNKPNNQGLVNKLFIPKWHL